MNLRSLVPQTSAITRLRYTSMMVEGVGFEPTIACFQGRWVWPLPDPSMMETTVGIEPTNTEVAAPRLTIWLHRHAGRLGGNCTHGDCLIRAAPYYLATSR